MNDTLQIFSFALGGEPPATPPPATPPPATPPPVTPPPVTDQAAPATAPAVVYEEP